jgi:membrane carboxypeptidase/penicillin-binding protein PbpC
MLAGVPQAPNRLRPDRFPDLAKARRDHVLDRMLALGMISPTRHEQAIAEPIDARAIPLPQSSGDAGYLPTALSIAAVCRGQMVQTTIDPAVQSQAARIAHDRLEQLTPSGVSAAAVVVLDSQTAELLAAVSISDDAPRVDLTRTARSTGSTLKPFIYAAAFDAGVCTPQTELNDTPAAWAGYAPTNYDREFRGTLSAAEALAESRNLPAMTVLSRVGVRRAVDVMGAMGLTTLSRTPDRFGLPLAIGGAEATPMELAEAYATLARGGNCKPISFTPIACGFADEAVRFAEPPFGSEPQGRRQAARHVVAEGGWDQHDGFAFRMRYVAIFEGATADFDLTRDPQLVLCRGGKSEAVALEKLSGYDLQVRHLIDAVARGDKTTLATLEDAAAVTEMLDAERESVLSGHSVEIETRKTT